MFLNVSYDRRYEPVFIGLVAAVLALGRKPRRTLEIQDRGQGRPERIFEILEGTRISFHDLSRAGVPARFNMPFELGLAVALKRYWRRHDWFVLEASPYRVQRTLSDLKLTEEHIHRNGPRIAESCVLDALSTNRRSPEPRAVERLRRRMAIVAQEVKRNYGRRDIFYRAAFRRFLSASIVLARRDGFIKDRRDLRRGGRP